MNRRIYINQFYKKTKHIKNNKKITKNLNGKIKIKNYPKSGSGVFTSMVETDGLIELPEKLTYLKKGTKIRFVPYSEILI